MRDGRVSVAPLVVGGLLLLESIAMLIMAVFVALIGGLTGALAFGVGAGSATNEQIARGALMVALTISSPFVMAGALALQGWLLVFRRGRVIVIAAAVVALALQVCFHVWLEEGFHLAELVPIALQLAAIGLGFSLRRAVVAPATAAS